MKRFILILAAIAFCAVWSFLGDVSPWAEVVGNSWVPYVAVPFAMGLVTPTRTLPRAALEGALVSVLMVIAFYIVVPFDDGYAVPSSSIFFWGGIGVVTGALLALTARVLVQRASASPWRLLLGSCSVLAIAYVAKTAYDGWGVVAVTTSSGVVYVGASTWDVVVSTIILLGFCCTLTAFALAPLLSRSTHGAVSAEHVSR